MTKHYWKPSVATDVVVFTIASGELRILLVERGEEPFKGGWALPGGFLRENESLDQCAAREVKEESGLANLHMEQLYTFGDPARDPRGRVITVAYMAILQKQQSVTAGGDTVDARWHDVRKLPKLAFDHHDVIRLAHDRLASKSNYSNILLAFMPDQFTLVELQQVYEAVRGVSMDKRNFRKWLLGLGLVEETGTLRQGGAHRPAALYRAVSPGRITYFA